MRLHILLRVALLVAICLAVGACTRPVLSASPKALPVPPTVAPSPLSQTQAPTAPTKQSAGPILIVNDEKSASDVGAAKSVRAALSSITGLPCKIVHISVCSPELLTRLNPRGIVIGGQKTPWWQYSPAELNGVYRMLRASRVPTLGICGGHQLIAKAFGGRVAPIRILRKGSKGYSGCYRERGWKPIKLQQGDPLFKGIGAVPRMWLNHCEEIKVIPQQFRTIGRGDVCKIQAIRHGTLPIYGMQFHPESADDAHPAGRQLLRNFVTMCKTQ